MLDSIFKFSSKRDSVILLGNVVDHFDKSLYGFIAPIIAPRFFPSEDPIIGLIITYSVMVSSIFTRPIGAYVFGSIARLYGAPQALSFSLIGIGLSSICIGLLPDYYVIGLFAPILLIIMRVLGGIFASGESSIAKLYILDDQTEKKAFKSSYLYQTSSAAGIAFASFSTGVINYFAVDYAWRFCFVAGGLASIIGYLIRKKVLLVHEVKTENILKNHLKDNLLILWRNKIVVIRIAIVNSFSHLTYLVPFVIMNSIIPIITEIELHEMLLLGSFMIVFDMILIPSIGSYVQRFSVEKVMFTASLVLGVTIIPLWFFIDIPSITYISFVRLWIVVWGVAYLCPLNLWCSKQIDDSRDKYIVIGIGSALGDSIIGKLSTVICLTIYYYTNSHLLMALYFSMLFISASLVIAGGNNALFTENKSN